MTEPKPDSPVLLSVEGALARLTLNRPAKKNALNLAMWRALPPLLAKAAADPAIRLLIVTGAGGAFAAGADIAEFSEIFANAESAAAYQADVAAANAALADFPRPTLALIRGACVGGGCGLALCCDVRFAETGARLGITPGKLGLVYPWGDMKRLYDAVGIARAKDLLFSGRLVGPDEALAIGLVQRICGPEDIENDVQSYARMLLGNSGVSLRTTKTLLHKMRDGAVKPDAEARALSDEAALGPDFKEGYTAFTEKRTPNFQ